MIDTVTFEKTSYAPAPARFEAGTPAIVEVIGLHAALDYIDAIGLDAIAAHEAALVAQTRDDALRSINSIRLLGPDDACGIVSFAMDGFTRTISAPYWTKAVSRSAPAIIAPSR